MLARQTTIALLKHLAPLAKVLAMEETLAKMDSVVETRTARTSQGTATKTPTAAMTPIGRVMALPMSDIM